MLEILFYRLDLLMILLIAVGLFACLHRVPVRYSSWLITLAVLAVNISILLETWHSGVSDHSLIAGLLPFSDSAGYVNGSFQLLFDGRLSPWASRRPITALLEGFILLVFSANYPAMLIALVVLASLSIAFVINETSLTYGRTAGMVMFFGLLVFYRRFIGSALSEHIGILYGCLAFAMLLRSLRSQNPLKYLLSLLLFSVALNARAGAYFILPAFVLMFPIIFRKSAGTWRKKIFYAVLSVSIAFFLNMAIVHTLGHKGSSMGNFSYTLYGLVHDGDWRQVLSDHPDIKKLNDEELYKKIYELSFMKIKEQPSSLIYGSIRAYKDLFFSLRGIYSYVLFSAIERHVLYREDRADDIKNSILQRIINQPFLYFQTSFAAGIFILLNILTIAGIYFLLVKKDNISLCIITGNLGILASVPFAPPWDADWMRAYASTIPVTLILPAIGLQAVVSILLNSKKSYEIQRMEYVSTARSSGLVLHSSFMLFAIIAAFFVFSIPVNIGKHLADSLPAVAESIKIIPNSEVHSVEEGKGSILKKSVSIDLAVRNMKVFLYGYPARGNFLKSILSHGTTLFLGYDTRARQMIYMICNTSDWNRIQRNESKWKVAIPEGDKTNRWRIVLSDLPDNQHL